MNESFIASAPAPLRVLRNDVFAAIAFGLFVVAAELTGSMQFSTGFFLATVTLSSVIALRRTHPIACCVLASVIAAQRFAMADPFMLFSFAAVLIAVYSISAFSERPLRHLGLLPLPAALLMLFGSLFFGWFTPAWPAPSGSLVELGQIFAGTGLLIVFGFVAVWALGLARRAQLVEVVRDRERAILLERDAFRLAELAVADERARIAREMHDIIAHSLASIVTLAEGGRMVASANPEQSSELFGKIATSGRDALTDVKRLLRRVDEVQESAPARGAGDIAALVENASDAGLPIRFVEVGESRRLPSGMSHAIYRVAQESVTNVLKHAPGAETTVTLEWEPTRVVLVTRNALDSPASSTSRESGRGLAGMRERTELFDGTFEATSKDFEFRIVTTWPTADETGARTPATPMTQEPRP